MTDNRIPDPAIAAAIQKIENFVSRATGTPSTSRELADALTRYFVLNEILAFVKMHREEQGDKS